eukprot:TRINITY_DN34446_c0_g1_i1.p1 TRINITY_DN34446_c0_g1~~TRINITY_DN34446_c0_g1_i1.p1  ORF type:complete len:111 (-),score=39.54 TRINITY_DN34446_c0_g1_i1:40-342(-)
MCIRDRIREQLQDYARMRTELATAQAHLTKSALQWRGERAEHSSEKRQRSLLRLGGILKGWTDLGVCRMLAKWLSLIHISEPTRLLSISYAVFCLKKKKK